MPTWGASVCALYRSTAGLMSKTDEDTLDDFRSVYEFDEAFSRDALLTGIGAV